MDSLLGVCALWHTVDTTFNKRIQEALMNSTSHKSNGWTSGCLVLSVIGFVSLCWLLSLGYMTTLHMLGL